MTILVPNTIANGDPQDAGPINQNFQAIANQVNAQVVFADGSTPMSGPLTLPGEPTEPNHAANKTYVDQLGSMIAGAVPTGTMAMYGGGTAPSGWLLCQGQAVSRVTYAALFAVIGTTYGAGDGVTTFNLPNLKGKLPIGFDSSDSRFNPLGKTGGSYTALLTTSNLPSHSHSFTGTTESSGDHSHSITTSSNSAGTPSGTISSGGSHTHTTDSAGAHSHSLYNQLLTSVKEGTGTSKGVADDNVGLGSTSDNGSHTHTVNSGGSHSHTFSGTALAAHGHTGSTDTAAAHSHAVSGTTDATGSGSAFDVINPYLTVNFIIKT